MRRLPQKIRQISVDDRGKVRMRDWPVGSGRLRAAAAVLGQQSSLWLVLGTHRFKRRVHQRIEEGMPAMRIRGDIVANQERVEEYKAMLAARMSELHDPLVEALRRLSRRAFHPEVDLAQFEFFQAAAESFPIGLLCKRTAAGIDHYVYGQSIDPYRTVFRDDDRPELVSSDAILIDEPLMTGQLVPYYYNELPMSDATYVRGNTRLVHRCVPDGLRHAISSARLLRRRGGRNPRRRVGSPGATGGHLGVDVSLSDVERAVTLENHAVETGSLGACFPIPLFTHQNAPPWRNTINAEVALWTHDDECGSD